MQDYLPKRDALALRAEIENQPTDSCQEEVRILKARFEDFQKDIIKRVGSCATLGEFQELVSIVEDKVNN